jgi:hypothetical protein
MRKAFVTAAVIAIAGLAWGLPARGQVQPVPGPGSGVVTVVGRVEVADGMVHARQIGDWRVAVANTPDVRVVNTATVAPAPLPFLKTGVRLQVTWPGGSTQTVRVAQLGGGGWCLIEGSGTPHWINLNMAQAVDEVR